MVDPKTYITANTATIAENCICFLLWHNRPVSETIRHSCDHANMYFPGIKNDLYKSVFAYLEKVTKNQDEFIKFIKSRMNVLVKPHYNRAITYIYGEWETTMPVSEIITAVRCDMGEGVNQCFTR